MSVVNSATDTNYGSIADMHLYLNLDGASKKEYEFLSGSNGSPMITWEQWLNWVLFNQKVYDAEGAARMVKNAIDKYEQKQPCDYSGNNVGYSIYDILSMDNRLTKMKAVVDYAGYGKVNEDSITFFAPVDDLFDEIVGVYHPVAMNQLKNAKAVPSDQSLSWSGLDRSGWFSVLQFIRYHILPYVVEPSQMQDRKLKLRTDLELQFINTDWTKDKYLLMNPISTRQTPGIAGVGVQPWGNPIPALPDSFFPKRDWEVQVLGSVKCTNGMLYIISRPLVFQSVL